VVTKLDVLSGLPPIKICVAYKAGGKTYTDLPMGVADLSPFEPVYEELPGWTEPITGVRAWEDLPEAAQRYVRRLAEVCGVPVQSVSVGPERDQVVEA
jgi:adenylosuccinate synthase